MAVQLVLVITINFLLLLTIELAEAAPIPLTSCKLCVNVSIPYTFQVGPSCYTESWTTGSKLFAKELEPS